MCDTPVSDNTLEGQGLSYISGEQTYRECLISFYVFVCVDRKEQ